MTTLIIDSNWKQDKLDGSVAGKAFRFLAKLQTDHTSPGLHIEPIAQSLDPRVRTGRVDRFWRAVMFRVDAESGVYYVLHGIWPHDDAIAKAKRVSLRLNPINGLPEITEALQQAKASAPIAPTPPSRVPEQAAGVEDRDVEAPVAAEPAPEPWLVRIGHSMHDLTERLGMPEHVAQAALAAPSENDVLDVADRHRGWLQNLLIDLAASESIETLIDRYELAAPVVGSDEEADLLDSLQRPAAQAQFAFITGQDELRRVIEGDDFSAWRVFLHPEQRQYVEKKTNGSFRLSGSAGTGKTVVLAHRTARLASREPEARIVLTTFTRNLAQSLQVSLKQLDETVPAVKLGESGVLVTGIDALAATVIRNAGDDIHDAVIGVLGSQRSNATGRARSDRWRQVLDATSTDLPVELANEVFLSEEYQLIVLPKRITELGDYLRVRRAGRGTALSRARRKQVWELISAYRAQGNIEGTLDFQEAAAVAAAYSEGAGADTPRTQADHVLVDEGQDLTPAHWQLLRALVPEGPDDLFIADDVHQRIYGPRVVLSHYDIQVRGRSRRMRLNYRTTAENLRYAMAKLEGGEYVDVEQNKPGDGQDRSARSGPEPVEEAATSLTERLEQIVAHVRRWDAAGVPRGTIAVLVEDRYQRERIVKELVEADIPAQMVDRGRPSTDQVLIMTMHRAKGMEFSRVVLADAAASRNGQSNRWSHLAEAERADAELRRRSLIYVAATRARDELVVVERE